MGAAIRSGDSALVFAEVAITMPAEFEQVMHKDTPAAIVKRRG